MGVDTADRGTCNGCGCRKKLCITHRRGSWCKDCALVLGLQTYLLTRTEAVEVRRACKRMQRKGEVTRAGDLASALDELGERNA